MDIVVAVILSAIGGAYLMGLWRDYTSRKFVKEDFDLDQMATWFEELIEKKLKRLKRTAKRKTKHGRFQEGKVRKGGRNSPQTGNLWHSRTGNTVDGPKEPPRDLIGKPKRKRRTKAEMLAARQDPAPVEAVG